MQLEPVLVAGAGALGSVLGGMLARAGWPVTLLGRAPHLRAIRRDGLQIEGLFGEHRVHDLVLADDVAEIQGRFSVILLTVKSWDTAPVVRALAGRLSDEGVLICLQNGLGNLEAAAEVIGGPRVLGARVIFGSEIVAPGRVRVTVYADPVLVGSPDASDAVRTRAAITWAERLDAAGVPARSTTTLLADLWAKVLYNAALNPLGALLGVPYGRLAEDTATREIMDAVVDETFAVATASGVRLAWPDAAAYRRDFCERLVPSTAGHRSSMLQDLDRGRPTEIDAINGYVASLGRSLGMAVPVSETLTRLIHARVRCTRAGEASV
jgi:2-dehydropantoate 2-reductase